MTTLRIAVSAVVALLAACAPPPVATTTLPVPRALLSCAAPPADLEARLWVSGVAEPCALEVDVEAGTTTGSCDVPPGRVRRLSIDWYVVRDVEGAPFDLLLAQARGELDLQGQQAADARFELDDDDVVYGGCLDLRADAFDGSATVNVGGAGVPVCDVDDSCQGADPATCGNAAELCAGSDPFDATDEPA